MYRVFRKLSFLNLPGFLWREAIRIPAFFIFKKGAGFQLPIFSRSPVKNGVAVVGMSRSTALNEPLEGEFTYVSGDVSKREDRQNLVETTINIYGRIDILVNVAGIAPRVRADLLEMTEESYDHVMNVNTKGMMFLTQAVANEMIKITGEYKGYTLFAKRV